MQYQVPQFIDVEDKIIGPLSLRQFLYICGTVGIILMLYFVLAFWLWATLSIIIGSFGAAMALVKVNGRSFGRLAASASRFYWQPQTYVWLPEHPGAGTKEDVLKNVAEGAGFSLENILSGMALKSAWQSVQVGSKSTAEKIDVGMKRAKEKYEIVERLTGDRKAAKRVDYR